MFPHANEVDVKVHKLSNGEFRSSIKVFVPKKKVLIAQKRDEDVKKCLEKSHLAIVRQVHRIKTKWGRRKNRHLSLVV